MLIWEPESIMDIVGQVAICAVTVVCTVVGKYCLMIDATKRQAFEIGNLLPNHKYVMNKLGTCGKQQTREAILGTINWSSSLVAAATWGYFGGMGNVQIAQFFDGLGGKWCDLASIFKHPAAITVVGGSTFVGNSLLLPLLQKIAIKAFSDILSRFYSSSELQKEQLLASARSNLWLQENLIKAFQQVIIALKKDAGNDPEIANNLAKIKTSLTEMLMRNQNENSAPTLQEIINIFKNLDDETLKALISNSAIGITDDIDTSRLLHSEMGAGILGLSIAVFASIGYVGIFDIAAQLSKFLKILPKYPELAKTVQVVSFASTVIPIFALVYEYGFLLITDLHGI